MCLKPAHTTVVFFIIGCFWCMYMHNDCVKVNVHDFSCVQIPVYMYIYMYMHIYLHLDTCVHHKADYQGVVMYTKNVVK